MNDRENKNAYTSSFALDVSTSYGNSQNGLPLLVELLDQNLNDNHFFVAKTGDIRIYNQAGIEINALEFSNEHTYQGIDLTRDFVFESGDKIYIRGTSADDAKVVVYALGSNDGDRYLTYLSVDCDTYISAENIEVVSTKVVNAESIQNTIFVEVGKSVSLTALQDNEEGKVGYRKDNGSARNVQLAFQSNSANLTKNIEVSYQNIGNDTPTITITGKTANTKNTYIYAYLELPNFITSEVFKIFVFESVSNIVVTVDDKQSILKNIEYGDHAYAGVSRSLSYMAIKNVGNLAYVDLDVATSSLNRKVDAYNITYAPNQTEGVIYFDSQNKSRLYLNGNAEIDYTNILNLEITVETLMTGDEGEIILTKKVVDDIRLQIIKELKESDVSIFYVLDNLEVSKSTQTIYWRDQLPDDCDVVQKNLIVGLDIKNDFLDYVSWINESEYVTGGLVNSQDKTRYSLAAIYENYRLGGGVEYEKIPAVINGRIGVQVNYFGQIITKYLTFELKKPVIPAYMRLEQPTSENTYSIETNGARGYIVNVIKKYYLTADREIVSGKTYYEYVNNAYQIVLVPDVQNIANYFEALYDVDAKYFKTKDTAVNAEKTY
ncbi:MAG: hypothetical protein J6T39_01945, partial [Clostridia bacterium]|nr:hypothetical protein [Clostridia bacterium]